MEGPPRRGIGNRRTPRQREQLEQVRGYRERLSTQLLADPAGYLENVPSRNRASAIKSLQAKMQRVINTPERDDAAPYNPLNPTIAKSAKAAEIQGLGMMIAALEAEGASEAANDRYKRDFIAWMMGKGKEEDHRKTPWYRSDWAIRTLPDVQEFVDSLVDIIYETEFQLVRLITTPPSNMRELEAYYKYVVNMDWMRRDDSFFFVDMVEFINGGKMGGGLTNTELEKFNVRQLKRARTTNSDKKYSYNERNTQATNDDVFKLEETDMRIYRGNKDEAALPHHELVMDHERGVRVNVEGAGAKLEALHQNVHQTREEVGRNKFLDANKHRVDAGVFTKNYQSVEKESYGSGLAIGDIAREPEEDAPEPPQPPPADEFAAVFDDEQIQQLRETLRRHLEPDYNAQQSAFDESQEERAALERVLGEFGEDREFMEGLLGVKK